MTTLYLFAVHSILPQYDVRSKKRAQLKLSRRRWNGAWVGESPGFVFRTFQGILGSVSSTDLKVQRSMETSHHSTYFFVGFVKDIKGYPM